jgi:hypothetical protein
MLEFALAERKSTVLRIWRFYLILAVLQCLGVMAFALTIRFVPAGIISRTHGVIVILLAAFSLPFLYLLVETWGKPGRAADRVERIIRALQIPKYFALVLVPSVAVFILGSFFITLVPEIKEPFTFGIFQRLFPFALIASGLALQTLVALQVVRHGTALTAPRPGSKVFYAVVVGIALSFAVWAWVVSTILPEAARIVGWNPPGVPLLAGQVLLAWLAGMGMLALIDFVDHRPNLTAWISRIRPARVDLAIAVLIWLAAVLVWQSIPVQPNWFLTMRAEPNNEYYPASDARIYDLVAQSALVGTGYRFGNDINIRRPLHAMYLTMLHLAKGQDYDSVVSLQAAVLALFPVLVYLLVKTLHQRASGIVAALLVLFREANSITLSGNITSANAKILLVDLPTAVLLAGFLYLAVVWLAKAADKILWAILSGQALGLAMLIRLETSVVFGALAVVIAILFISKRQYLLLFRQLALFLLGVILVLSPWVYRNWRQTGLVYLNEPYFRFALIIQRFRPEKTPAADQPVGATPAPVETLQSPGLPTEAAAVSTPVPAPTPIPLPIQQRIEQTALQYLSQAFQNPAQIVSFSIAHYLNSQLQLLLALPNTYRGIDAFTGFLGHRSTEQFWFDCCSALGYVRRMPFWPKWTGEFYHQSAVPIIFNSLILAAGIQAAWNRRRWVGLLPLLALIVYLGLNAVFRNSGGRYLLPVDWIGIVYFSIGLIHVSSALISYLGFHKMSAEFGVEQAHPGSSVGQPPGSWVPALLSMGMLLIGILVPIAEKVSPQHYPEDRKARMIAALFDSDQIPVEVKEDLQKFLDGGAFIAAGRILYPQYYGKDIGSLGRGDGSIGPKPYPRLVFSLAGDWPDEFVLPLKKIPLKIPNASDGLVIACPGNYALALAVFNSSNDLESLALYSPSSTERICPIPEQQKIKR